TDTIYCQTQALNDKRSAFGFGELGIGFSEFGSAYYGGVTFFAGHNALKILVQRNKEIEGWIEWTERLPKEKLNQFCLMYGLRHSSRRVTVAGFVGVSKLMGQIRGKHLYNQSEDENGDDWFAWFPDYAVYEKVKIKNYALSAEGQIIFSFVGIKLFGTFAQKVSYVGAGLSLTLGH
ncbi:MAG TPA: hypothetical protein PLG25_09575, partial [bacterium]|nr:hypothetical protein [bacterium]